MFIQISVSSMKNSKSYMQQSQICKFISQLLSFELFLRLFDVRLHVRIDFFYFSDGMNRRHKNAIHFCFWVWEMLATFLERNILFSGNSSTKHEFRMQIPNHDELFSDIECSLCCFDAKISVLTTNSNENQ